MLILNLAHPPTQAQLTVISRMPWVRIGDVVEIKTQLDSSATFVERVQALIEGNGFSSGEWQTKSLVLNLPSFSPVAALVLAELHGRIGYFPAILRLRQISELNPPQIEVAEIINLQAARDAARQQR